MLSTGYRGVGSFRSSGHTRRSVARGRKPTEPSSRGVSPWPLDRREYDHRLRTHMPSTKQALNEAVGRVLKIARDCGCLDDGEADLEIALREALANAIIHGNAYGATKRIFLRCYAAPSSGILIIVRDEGPGCSSFTWTTNRAAMAFMRPATSKVFILSEKLRTDLRLFAGFEHLKARCKLDRLGRWHYR